MSRLIVVLMALAVIAIVGTLVSRGFNPSVSAGSDEALYYDTIRQYERDAEIWEKALEEIRNGPEPEEQKLARFDELVNQRPEVDGAIDAATALLAGKPSAEDVLTVARFLIEKTSGSKNRSRAMLQGMLATAQYDKAFADWPNVLLMVDVFTPPGVSAELDEFFENFNQHVVNQPVAQAAARYYAARRRMTLANWVKENGANEALDQRLMHRELALQFAEGLSLGVEDHELVRRQPPGDDGEPLPYPTFAEAEKELLFLLNALTVGGMLPNTTGRTLEGGQDELLRYRGKVVLLDFWATWCAPCIEALPKLAELKTQLPGERFEIVSINTDATLETLLEFQQSQPMPWVHWYAGENAPLLRAWAIRGFPTYMLVDASGTLLAKQFVLNDALIALIRTTTCDQKMSVAC